jgi:hypothetical protein
LFHAYALRKRRFHEEFSRSFIQPSLANSSSTGFHVSTDHRPKTEDHRPKTEDRQEIPKIQVITE